MGKEKKTGKESKNGTQIRILFSILALTVLLMVELDIMINDSQNYIYMVIVEVIMLIVVYLLVTSVLRQSEKRQEKLEEQYENIFKSEKASYLLIRKKFAEIEECLAKMEKGTSFPKDDIVSAQKAIAKITINRNKENTDTLMNSNEMMMEKLSHFENLLEESNSRLLEKQKEMLAENNEKIIEQQQEIEKLLHNTIEELREIIAKGASAVLADETAVMPEVMIEPEILPMEEEFAESEILPEVEFEATSEPEVTSDILPEIEFEAAPAEAEVPEESVEPEIMQIEEEQTELEIMEEPEAADPNKMMGPDDIEALLASMGSEDAGFATDPEPESIPEIEFEATSEPEIIPEPLVEATVEPEPVPMSALEALAKRQPKEEPVTETTVEPEPIPEPLAEAAAEPEPIPEPVSEPEQDLDPNRKMSPEEIASLFQNL